MSTAPSLPPNAIRIAAGETMSEKEHHDLLEMQKVVYGYTVPIRVDCFDKVFAVGTGVVIEIGHRTFIASAGHVLSKNPRVMFGENPAFDLDAPATKFLNRDYRDPPDDDFSEIPMTRKLDIGFLEVPNNSHHTACYFKSLTDIEPPPNTLAMIVGHPIDAPGSLADPRWNTGRYFEIVRTAHSGAMKEVRDEKYVFDYSKDVLNLDATTGYMAGAKGFRSPKGFSGGGLWGQRDLGAIEGLIYAGSRYRLFGLDYAWSSTRREAFCVPIRYWVKLVYDNYPDLRAIIKEQFPKIE